MPARHRARLVACALPLAASLVAAIPAADGAVPPPVAARGARHARLDITITGVVRDSATGTPIAGVAASIEGTSFGATTAADGRYAIAAKGLTRGGRVALVVRRIGYASQRIVLRADHAHLIADVALVASPVRLQEQVAAQARAERERRAKAGAMVSVDATSALNAQPVAPSAPPPRVNRQRFEAPVGYGPGDAPADIRRRSAPWNTEEYDRIDDNPFLGARANPLSTFSVDVDRASYANVRRFLAQGQRPPRDAVRIEELVNYFRYDYEGPEGRHPVAIHTELAAAPWSPRHQLLKVGLQAKRIDLRTAPPNNLVFLIDVSGSMMDENKLPLLKQAFRLLVDELRPQDRVALVVYAGAAGVVLPSTSGEEKTRILAALDGLQAGGSTAGGAGITLAYDIAEQHFLKNGNNRVILATDGDFNVGTSSTSELTRLVETRRERGTFLTVLGFGMGNYKDGRLEQLADKGNGNYAYIDDLLEARKTLVTELGGTLVTVAKDVKLQVEFNPAKVYAYRLVGYENRMLRAEDFNNDRKDAGEMGAGHSVTALYEIVPVGAESSVQLTGVDSLRFSRPATPSSGTEATGGDLAYVKLRYKEPDGTTSRLLEHAVQDRVAPMSTDFTFASSVAAFGMLLRDSEHKGSADWRMVARLARAGKGADAEGYRGEFIRMVESVGDRVVADGAR